MIRTVGMRLTVMLFVICAVSATISTEPSELMLSSSGSLSVHGHLYFPEEPGNRLQLEEFTGSHSWELIIGKGNKRVTVRVGVFSRIPQNQDTVVKDFFSMADGALYAAKENGRNLVNIAVDSRLILVGKFKAGK